MIKAIAAIGTTTATAIFPPAVSPWFTVVVAMALVVLAALTGAVEEEVVDTED